MVLVSIIWVLAKFVSPSDFYDPPLTPTGDKVRCSLINSAMHPTQFHKPTSHPIIFTIDPPLSAACYIPFSNEISC